MQKAVVSRHNDTNCIDDVVSFAAILQRNLGAKKWSGLDPAIQHRFRPTSISPVLKFSGIMHWIYSSPIGIVYAWVLKYFSILPGVCSRNQPFDFRIATSNQQLVKQRDYYLGDKQHFQFRSYFNDTPRLHEEFKSGLGMYLQLEVMHGDLIFRDQGYFWRIGQWRLPLSRWLGPGRFELVHHNLDQQRFQVTIRIAHPLFGTLFYQRGEFSTLHYA